MSLREEYQKYIQNHRAIKTTPLNKVDMAHAQMDLSWVADDCHEFNQLMKRFVSTFRKKGKI